ncbi:MAG TPA: DUF5668 domain-containing protein [Thermoanaerobaculia bacterium]|jgi:hypothetical protein
MEQPNITTATNNDEIHRVPTGKIVFGLVLVVVGVVAFLDSVDLWNPRIWEYWPLILIIIGLGSEIEALRNRRSDGGAFLIAIGVWFFVATQGWFDLSLGRALPIAIAVWGAFLTLHAIVDRPKSAQEKKS